MNTNFQTQLPAPNSLSSEGTAVGLFAAALLLAKRLFAQKVARPELISRSEFYTEMVALKDQMHVNHLALLDKLDMNHRELLAVLDRQVTRINALESALARVDERTSKGGRTSP